MHLGESTCVSAEAVGRSPNSSLLYTWVSQKSDLTSLVKYLRGAVLSLQPEKSVQVAKGSCVHLCSLRRSLLQVTTEDSR